MTVSMKDQTKSADEEYQSLLLSSNRTTLNDLRNDQKGSRIKGLPHQLTSQNSYMSAISMDDHYSTEDDNHELLSPLRGSILNIQRRITAVERRMKTIKLSSKGHFSVNQQVPQQILNNASLEFCQDEESFRFMKYTACSCDPDDFVDNGYTLRAARSGQRIELFIVVTMYNESPVLFNRTMFALAQNIKYLCQKNKYGWDNDGWKRIAVCIVSDGRAKIDPDVLKCLEVMGVYQDGVMQASINGVATTSHIFEYTAQNFLDEKFNVWGCKKSNSTGTFSRNANSFSNMFPMQTIFCLKEKNAKKINSHRWFFNAFSPILDPTICVLVDVGTKPEKSSIYHIWKAFFRNDQIAGACGEIRADLGEGMTMFKNLLNPLVASQNFEYKISNLLDKSLESVFGYITVLPGAFSAYRYQALLDNGPGDGPLVRYFEGEQRSSTKTLLSASPSIFTANLYLAEDRILCFELVSRANARWTLHYVKKAYADTDVPDTVPEFLSQRRRWLNGSFFAGIYALANMTKVWRSDHSLGRKIAFTVQYIYNIANQIFSWFVLANFALTFYFLTVELKTILTGPTSENPDSTRNMIISIILQIANYSYIAIVIALFVISFGNRPQAFKKFYKGVMIAFGMIGAVMIALLIRRLVSLATSVNLFHSSTDYMKEFEDLSDKARFIIQSEESKSIEQQDNGMYLIGRIVQDINVVMMDKTLDSIDRVNHQLRTYLVALASTLGVFFTASLLQLDIAHLFTCLLQYMLMLPSYINVLTVHALANLSDVSWGTKGDTKAEELPKVNGVQNHDGTITADVNIASSSEELDARYNEILFDLKNHQEKAKSFSKPVENDPRQKQEDDYKGFRTKMVLVFILTNALLFLTVTNVTKGDVYIQVLLWTIAALSGLKLVGVILFLVFHLFTDVFHFFDSKLRSNFSKKSKHGHSPLPS